MVGQRKGEFVNSDPEKDATAEADPDAIPEHLRGLELTPDQHWTRILALFEHLTDFVGPSTRLESPGEAVRAAKPKGKRRRGEPAIQEPTRSDLIPHVSSIPVDRLEERRKLAQTLVPSLRQQIAAKQLTLHFVSEWGRFCTLAGALEFVYFLESSPGQAVAGAAGGKAVAEAAEKRKRWFAKLFMYFYTRRPRQPNANNEVTKLLRALLNSPSDVGPRVDEEWIRSFFDTSDSTVALSEDGELRAVYREQTIKESRRLAELPDGDLPPIDIVSWEPLVRGKKR